VLITLREYGGNYVKVQDDYLPEAAKKNGFDSRRHDPVFKRSQRMERVIKFRQFYHGLFHYFEYTDGICSGPASASIKNYPITQFTGLIDKNGKEIYEGDIIDVAGTPVVVCWNKECASFSCRKIDETEPYSDHLYGCQNMTIIIGNIFENPELLKEPTK
jgi:hypothetical protein